MSCRPSSTSISNADASACCCERRLRVTTATILKSSHKLGQAQTTELPTRHRVKEIPVAHALMTLRGRKRRAAQDHLADHELAVVLPERAFNGPIARIREIGAARPLPGNAKRIRHHI